MQGVLRVTVHGCFFLLPHSPRAEGGVAGGVHRRLYGDFTVTRHSNKKRLTAPHPKERLVYNQSFGTGRSSDSSLDLYYIQIQEIFHLKYIGTLLSILSR